MNIYTVWLNGLIFPMVSREGEEERREVETRAPLSGPLFFTNHQAQGREGKRTNLGEQRGLQQCDEDEETSGVNVQAEKTAATFTCVFALTRDIRALLHLRRSLTHRHAFSTNMFEEQVTKVKITSVVIVVGMSAMLAAVVTDHWAVLSPRVEKLNTTCEAAHFGLWRLCKKTIFIVEEDPQGKGCGPISLPGGTHNL